MAESSTLRRMQLGPESVQGTAVAATTVWRGKGSMDNTKTVVHTEEDIGQYAPEPRAYIPRVGGMVAMDSTPATFEQLPYVCEAGIHLATPSGTESPYTYSYSLPSDTSTEPTLRTYTIEYGTPEDNEEMEYSFVESFELSGAAEEAVMMTATWIGRQVTATAATGSLSIPAVEEILFQQAKLYIDDSGGSVGSTQVSNSMKSFTFTVTTGWKAEFTGEGELYFSFAKLVKPDVKMTFVAEHTSDWDSAGEKGNWDGSTVRLVRVQIDGTSSRQLTIDVAGIWNKFQPLSDLDGNTVITGELWGKNSSDDSLYCDIEIKNALSALP